MKYARNTLLLLLSSGLLGTASLSAQNPQGQQLTEEQIRQMQQMMQQQQMAEPPEATPELLHALGYTMAERSFFSFGFTEEELEHIFDGIRASVLDQEEPENMEAMEQQIEMYMQSRHAEFQARQQEEQAAAAQENVAAGEEFLAQMKEENPDIQSTESGLHYEILEEGTGKQPTENDRVRLHYTGSFPNGEVFDSSRQRGEPAVFSLRAVVPGFSEGLQLLHEGGKAKLYLPAEIAYGTQGRAPIPPGQLLIFDVELIEVMESQPRRTVTSPPIEVPARGDSTSSPRGAVDHDHDGDGHPDH